MGRNCPWSARNPKVEYLAQPACAQLRRDRKKELQFFSTEQIRLLLGAPTEPCASVVSIAVLITRRLANASRPHARLVPSRHYAFPNNVELIASADARTFIGRW